MLEEKLSDPYGPGSPPWEIMDALERDLDELSDRYSLAELWNWVMTCVHEKVVEYEAAQGKKSHDE